MFNKVLACLATVAILLSQADAQQTTPFTGQVKVRRGTVLNFTLLEPLDSATAKVGDDVALRLESPLVADGVTPFRQRNGSWTSHQSKASRSQGTQWRG